VAGADAGPVVTVEVLVEEEQVSPVRVVLKYRLPPVNGTAAVGASQKIRVSRSPISWATSYRFI
jgi:hypothetical protein